MQLKKSSAAALTTLLLTQKVNIVLSTYFQILLAKELPFLYFMIFYFLDQVSFVGVELVMRNILKFSLIKFYKILLSQALLPRNWFDPDYFYKEPL